MNLHFTHLAPAGECRTCCDLNEDHALLLGRASHAFPGPGWPDARLSREHVRLWCNSGRWFLARQSRPGAAEITPVYRDAARTRQIEEPHEIVPGEWLFIGRHGHTALAFTEGNPPPLTALDFLTPEKKSATSWQPILNSAETDRIVELPYIVRQRLQVQEIEIPKAIERWMALVNSAPDDDPLAVERLLFEQIAGVLEMTLQEHSGGGSLEVAFLSVDHAALAASLEVPAEKVAVLSVDARGWNRLNNDAALCHASLPSRHLLLDLLDDPRPGLLRAWHRDNGVVAWSSLGSRHDWVLAMLLQGCPASGALKADPPVFLLSGKPVVLYITCRGGGELPQSSLHPFIHSAALQVAAMIETREQQRLRSQLYRHFSPRLHSLLREEPAKLTPVEQPCTVLFFDRRGSSLAAENAPDLLSQLRENTDILNLVGTTIFDHDGSIAEFTGDGILGFWGWPPGQNAAHHEIQAIKTACEVAVALQQYQVPDPSLSEEMSSIVRQYTDIRNRIDFQCHRPTFRIGISTGIMAVGNVGLEQQMKIGVFGGPVNFGARLEGLGKMFQLPVIVSDETREAVGDRALMRKLCLVRPVGFAGIYPVHELVLPRKFGGSGANEDQIARYEQALDCFIHRKFDCSRRLLAGLVAEGDIGAVWLLRTTVDFLKNEPGPGWQGEINASSK